MDSNEESPLVAGDVWPGNDDAMVHHTNALDVNDDGFSFSSIRDEFGPTTFEAAASLSSLASVPFEPTTLAAAASLSSLASVPSLFRQHQDTMDTAFPTAPSCAALSLHTIVNNNTNEAMAPPQLSYRAEMERASFSFGKVLPAMQQSIPMSLQHMQQQQHGVHVHQQLQQLCSQRQQLQQQINQLQQSVTSDPLFCNPLMILPSLPLTPPATIHQQFITGGEQPLTSSSCRPNALVVSSDNDTAHYEPKEVYTNATSLALPTDSDILDPIQNFLRSVCIEIFAATEDHVKSPGKGSRPSAVGQVGFRCVYCKDISRNEIANQAISFPTRRGSVYEGVRNFQRIHIECCPLIPEKVMAEYSEMEEKAKSFQKKPLKAVKAYFAQAAAEVGLVDGEKGMEFGPRPVRTPSKELMDIINAANDPDTSPSFWYEKLASYGRNASTSMGKFERVATPLTREVILNARRVGTPLVYPQDFATIPDSLYLLFHQVVPCQLTAATIKRRGLTPEQCKVNSGMCCKYCAFKGERSGRGTYFPIELDALADSSFSQTLSMHLMSCVNTPDAVKYALKELKNLASDHKIVTKRNSKKKFMEKIWKRMCEHYGKGNTKLATALPAATVGIAVMKPTDVDNDCMPKNASAAYVKKSKKQFKRHSAPALPGITASPVTAFNHVDAMRRSSEVMSEQESNPHGTVPSSGYDAGILMREPVMCFSPDFLHDKL